MLAFFRTRRSLRAAMLCLLAVVMPLQCSAALLRAVAGPAHVHASATAPISSVAVLDDVRRMGLSRASPEVGAASLLGSVVHGHTHSQRHRHFEGDAGVATADGAALDRSDAADENASSGAFAGLLPLATSVAAWHDIGAAHRRPTSAAWAATSIGRGRLDRPPQGTAA